jgi:hypothetical protein
VLLKPDETQGREGMNRHQRITSVLVFVALIAAAFPGAGLASSLLSGYGGPGEGNQAVLGSALLNAPKGGGGGGGGAGAGSLGSGQASSGQSGEAAASPGAKAGATSKRATHKGSSGRTRSAKPAAGGGTAQASHTRAVIYPAASREVTTGGSRALGLSGADFVYIILALGVLALTGLLTVRLTRTTVARGRDGRL